MKRGRNLDLFSLGWGGADYTFGTLDLLGAGLLLPGDTIVIGGPTDPNGFDFTPDLPDGFLVAAGVGLFDVDSSQIASATPVDALIYGTGFVFGNTNNLIDETGAVGAVDIVTGGSGQSAARDATGTWGTSATPTPGIVPFPVPQPSTALLLSVGLFWIGRRPCPLEVGPDTH